MSSAYFFGIAVGNARAGKRIVKAGRAAALCGFLCSAGFVCAQVAHADEPVAPVAAEQAPAIWMEPTLDMTAERQRETQRADAVSGLYPEKLIGTLLTATNSALSVRNLPETNSGRGASNGALFYPFNLGRAQFLADPQFLPGGREAIVKIKFQPNADEAARFHLYQFNLESMKLQKLTEGMLTHDAVQISPDGQFIAFFRGIDETGQQLPGQTVQLCVLERKTGREQVVARDNSLLPHDWIWTPSSTLLATKLAALPANGGATNVNAANELRPHLYEFSIKDDAPKLLVRDGWFPQISPNGERLVFFGAQDPSTPDALPANWKTNPRGVYLCVANRDGSARRATVRQTGTYPKLQWKPDSRTVMTIKAKRWTSDLGDTRIGNFQPLRADEYKGGLAGFLDTDTGTWSLAFVLEDGRSSRDFDNRSPKPNLDYEFWPMGAAGDGAFNFVHIYRTEKTENGLVGQHIFSAIDTARAFAHSIVQLDETSRGFDWLDASTPGAVRPKVLKAAGLPRYFGPEAAPQIKALLQQLPPAAAAQADVLSELARRAERELTFPALPALADLPEAYAVWDKRFRDTDWKDDKAFAAIAYDGLSLAQRLLARDSVEEKNRGINFAVQTFAMMSGRDAQLGAQILFAYAVPILDAVQGEEVPLTEYFVGSLATYAPLAKLPDDFGLEVLKIALANMDANDPFDERVDMYRMQLAGEMVKRKRFEAAIEYLKLVKDAHRLEYAQKLIADYQAILAAP